MTTLALDQVPAGHKLAFVLEQVQGLVEEGALSPEAAHRIALKAQQTKTAGPMALLRRAKIRGVGKPDPPSAGKPQTRPAADMLKAIGVFSGVSAAALAGEHAYNKIQQRGRFNRMMEANPDMQGLDPQRVEMAYDTLQDFAPNMTRDPFAAGSAVKKMVEYEAVDPDTVSAYKNLERDQRPNLVSGMLRTVGSVAGAGAGL